MEAAKLKVRKLKKARIEIIPLIDVIFFLLATFVLFTLSLNRIQSIPVNLPYATNKPKDDNSKDDIVTIQVSGEGTVFWNREPIDMSEVPSRIAYYKSNTQVPKVMVSGDEKARFGATVLVLDELRKAGIEEFSVETRTRPTGK